MRNIYPFGKAPFVILIIAIISGILFGLLKMSAVRCVMEVALDENKKLSDLTMDDIRAAKKRPDLILVFQAEIHEELYKKAAEEFGKKHNCTVRLQRVQKEVLMDRLQSAMQTGCEVPDVVELLEGTIGYFTRGKIENVGLLDLTERLEKEGYLNPDTMVQKRYALWSSRGHIFAIPHDVHPAGLCYRVDLIQKLGIDVTKLKTWDDFVKVGQQITGEWEEDDPKLGIKKGGKRYMIDMADDSMVSMIILLTQRGFDLFDANGNVAFDKPEVADLIAWFVHQTRGIDRIAFPAGDGQNFYQAMKEGLDLFYFTPDWRTMQFTLDLNFDPKNPEDLKKEPSILKGKLALMPMPVWADENGNRLPGTYQTGTWGGSGLAITKLCKNRELAWEFAKYLYLEASDEDFVNRFKATNIVPPIKKVWKAKGFNDKSPFFKKMVHDEKTGELVVEPLSLGEFYASQADDTPPHYSTAYTSQAETQFLNVYYTARDFYESEIKKAGKNPSPETLKKIDDEMLALIKKTLKKNEAYIRRLIDRNVFLKDGVIEPPAAAPTAQAPAQKKDDTPTTENPADPPKDVETPGQSEEKPADSPKDVETPGQPEDASKPAAVPAAQQQEQ